MAEYIPSPRDWVREQVELYEKRPDQVRRTIVSQSSPGITAFADAFKFKREP